MSATVAQTLDVKGLSCPLPDREDGEGDEGAASGDLIEVLATDPGSVPDFSAWCEVDRQRARRADGGRRRVPLRHQEEVRR